MLSRSELEREGPPGFHLAQKEKDYLQHWVLAFLSRSGFGGAFKGGTCLQKCFGLPRYSEDLDFTLGGAQPPDFGSLSSFLSSAGFSVVSVKQTAGDVSNSAKLRYRGPLYNGSSISEGTLALDFSRREAVLLEPSGIAVTPPYHDLLPYSLRVMRLDEIAAEKVRALLTRVSARDLYDLHFVLRQGAALKKGLVAEKLLFYEKRFDAREFKKRVVALKKVWKSEMAALTPNPVDYAPVAKSVLQKARGL